MQDAFPSMILFGGDYNPEQWPEDVWLDDMRLMKLASINMVSINIFSWASLEPAPADYHFDQLDRIMDILSEHDIAADLATATASPPTWMSRLYPAMLPVTRDGKRLSHGSRLHYCPNSPDYRRKSAELVRHLAERYRTHPALSMWHVNNEYGTYCYCDACAEAFRTWLQARYSSLDKLNFAWGTDFWSQHYYAWEDILPPRISPAQNNPGQCLDYQRFMSDSLLACYLTEVAILREITPNIPITTNFMVAFKPADYFAWAPHVHIISIDTYPANTTPAWETALTHDLMRSLKGGQPYLVMEQSPSQVNWMPQNPHKRPGRMRLQSHQALAHGADGVMFFQWRQSKAGAEKFHSAIVPHAGSDQGRIFQQVAQLGDELKRLSPDVAGSRVPAQVAILMDWQNWWAVEYLPGPSDRLHYWEQIKTYYRPLHGLHVSVDIVSPANDLSGYRLVVAPLLHMLRPGVARNLEQFVERGGVLLTTFFSGIVDQNDHVGLGGYPAELRKLLGIHIEEFDPWTREMTNAIVIREGALQGTYPCTLWGEMVHLEGAHALGVFASDYYAGGPAITAHSFGQGHAYYLATQASAELLTGLMRQLCQEAGVSPVLKAPVGVEVTKRVRADGRTVYFLLNHNDMAEHINVPAGNFTELLTGREVEGQIEVAAWDVAVLLEKSAPKRGFVWEGAWEDFYKSTKDSPPWPLLIRAVSLLTHKERALDLGCGAGRDTRYLLQQGFHVTAVDSSPHAIALLAGLPKDNWRLVQSSFQDFIFETYDLVNAHFALPFNPQESFHEVFARVKDSIKPGGLFVGQLFGIHDEWNTPGNPMTFLTREQVENLFTGLEIIEFREEDLDGHTADGAPKHWHVFHIIAQKE